MSRFREWVEYMVRKEVTLDERDAELLARSARNLGVSESEVVRRGIEAVVRQHSHGPPLEQSRRSREEALARLFALADEAVSRAPLSAPSDVRDGQVYNPHLAEIARQRGWTRDELYERKGDRRRGWVADASTDAS